ncbi:hypothetical protein ACSAZL_04550 [Methanosarcina sp. T3]|uniref:hypothetical protein n=1 Tax=Methanosarcina sp. T3 TaxID=3439062 RepID=UPI003F84982F
MNSLKDLKANSLKYLIIKPKTADVNTEDVEDLTKNREEVKKKIKKLLKEKKEIDARIERAQKSETGKIEEISEVPWREEIFPPLPRKVSVKRPESLEVKNDSLHVIGSGVSKVKSGGLEIVVKGIVEKLEDAKFTDEKCEGKKSDDKKSGDIKGKRNNEKEISMRSDSERNDTEGVDTKNRAGKQGEDKTLPEKEEKIKPVYPFSAGKMHENIVPSENSSPISTDKGKPENKNNLSASLFGNELIEELLNSDDLNPEEEQSFMKYLEEPDARELIVDLKNLKAFLDRAGHAE